MTLPSRHSGKPVRAETWDDLVVVDQVDEPVGEKVRYADRADSPFGVELLHGPPRSVVVAEGLVDEVQVQRLQAEFSFYL